MNKYIIEQVVEAVAMTYGQARNSVGLTRFPNNIGPNVEGYYVKYPDGVSEWMHKDEFEKKFKPAINMTFGQALEAMKKGLKVARKGWNGKGMWLCIPLCDGPKEIPATGIWGKPNAEYAEKNGGTVKVVPYVTMKAADGTIVMGWLASQTDMISDDWVVVD